MDGGRAGAATIADYDGDGQPEIGIASAIEHYVYETDGTWLWSHEVQDVSSNLQDQQSLTLKETGIQKWSMRAK